MKKIKKPIPFFIPFIAITFLLSFSCSTPPKEVTTSQFQKETFPEKAKNMNIYEVNIRQYTPEGTFNAFATHLDRLKKMQIDILWLMPLQPIGEKNRKGSLGSYYAIKDYRAVNPEFGTPEDFKNLVAEIHKRKMYVIIDWVPNHTAWDHPWIEEHPDYYQKDEKGELTMAHDWSDVAQLDYENRKLRKSMIAAMKYWVTAFDIDGFRQDHAGHEIPLDFWEESREALDSTKNLFWLAEWNTPEMHLAFHSTYAWKFHHIVNEVAKGEQNAKNIKEYFKKEYHQFGKNALRLTFTTNHDENSWNGTVFERLGDSYEAMSLLSATLFGIPLIYSGQEAGLNKRLRFFEKDTIDWSNLQYEGFFTQLLQLRKNNPALWSGKYGGKATFVPTDNDNILAFKRKKDNNQVGVVINLSEEEQTFNITDTDFIFEDYFSKKQFNSATQKSLAKNEYFVGILN